MSRRTLISIGLVALTVLLVVLVFGGRPQGERAPAPSVERDSTARAMQWRAWRARWLPTAPRAPMPPPIPAQRPEWSRPHASMPSKPPPFPAQPPLRIEISADMLPRPPRAVVSARQ